jgi:hypothetical protein
MNNTQRYYKFSYKQNNYIFFFKLFLTTCQDSILDWQRPNLNS